MTFSRATVKAGEPQAWSEADEESETGEGRHESDEGAVATCVVHEEFLAALDEQAVSRIVSGLIPLAAKPAPGTKRHRHAFRWCTSRIRDLRDPSFCRILPSAPQLRARAMHLRLSTSSRNAPDTAVAHSVQSSLSRLRCCRNPDEPRRVREAARDGRCRGERATARPDPRGRIEAAPPAREGETGK